MDGIAPTLQAAPDDWPFIAPQLAALYEELTAGRARRPFEFDPDRCMAPLPRAYQLVVGEVDGARSGDEPRMVRCASDDLLGLRGDIVVAHEESDIHFDACMAVVTDDVAVGATPDEAHQQIRLLMLMNQMSLRNSISPIPTASFSPIAVTRMNWEMHGVMSRCTWRCARAGTALAGQLDAGVNMAFNFAQLIAHLARTRKVRPGSIVGLAIVANGTYRAGMCRLETSVAGRSRSMGRP